MKPKSVWSVGRSKLFIKISEMKILDRYLDLKKQVRKAINEATIKILNEEINEEMSIAGEVTVMVEEIFDILSEELKNKKITYAIPEDVIYREGKFNYECNGIKLTIQWRAYNRPNRYKNPNIPVSYASFNPSNKIIRIMVNAEDGKIDIRSLRQSLQHELSHAFENFKRREVPYKRIDRYERAYQILTDANNNGRMTLNLAVAMVIYISYKFEQRAFYNGAYQYMMQQGEEKDLIFDYDELVVNTKLFKWIGDLTYALLYIGKHEGNMKMIYDAIEPYGLQYPQLWKMGHIALDNLKKLAKRLKKKVEKDYRAKYRIHESIEPFDFTNEEKIRKHNEYLRGLNRKYFCKE